MFLRICGHCKKERLVKEISRKQNFCKTCAFKWKYIRVRTRRAIEIIHKLQEITARLHKYISTGSNVEGEKFRNITNSMIMLEEEIAELSNESQEILLSPQRP